MVSGRVESSTASKNDIKPCLPNSNAIISLQVGFAPSSLGSQRIAEMKYSMVLAANSLPAEVIYLVLDEILQHGDSSTLKAMSLASKDFLPLCRSKLFRNVTLRFATDRHYSQSRKSQIDLNNSSETLVQFIEFLTSNTHIMKSISQLALLDISRIPSWSIGSQPPSRRPGLNDWSMVAIPLVRLLGRIEHLQTVEIRSSNELDWTTFDAQIKCSIYDVLQRSSCAFVSLRMSSVVNICDSDLCKLLSISTDIAFSSACFNLQGPKSLPATPSNAGARGLLETVQFGRRMGDDAMDMVQYYPEYFVGVRRLVIESLSAAASVSQFWTLARATRETLQHLEWWFEDLAYRAPEDAVELQQIDLSIFPELRSVAIRSSQSGLLINLMVILEATGANNHIERISIIMPSSIDKFTVFSPSAVWKRLDTVLGGIKFRLHLREVALSFAWTHQPIPTKSLNALFSAFKKNLPSLRGKDLTVTQKIARPF